MQTNTDKQTNKVYFYIHLLIILDVEMRFVHLFPQHSFAEKGMQAVCLASILCKYSQCILIQFFFLCFMSLVDWCNEFGKRLLH